MTEIESRLNPDAAYDRDDAVLPFQVDALDVRGRSVRLGAVVDRILHRHAYPNPVSRLLGEAVALTALLGTSLKFEGRFQLQTRTDGAVDMLVVDFAAPDQLRGYARFNAEKLASLAPSASPSDLLGKGHLAFTIDQGAHMQRYQGLVPLDGQGLEEAAHQYFLRSEQIPTRLRLAVAEEIVAENGESRSRWRAGGLFVQFLPQSIDRQRQAEFDPGDAPEGTQAPEFSEDDSWVEARSLVETIEDHELVDPALSAPQLLYRLFHERGARVFDPVPMVERCHCSSTRILDMLKRFTEEEKQAMLGEDGQIGVTCEFCSTRYRFTLDEVK